MALDREAIEKLLDQPASRVMGTGEGDSFEALPDDTGTFTQDSQTEEDEQEENEDRVSSDTQKPVVGSKKEQRVPYSRLEAMKRERDDALEDARKVRDLEQRLATYEETARRSAADTDELPGYWVKLYGDSDVSREAYKADQQQRSEERARMRDELREEIRNSERDAIREEQTSLDSVDSALEDFVETAGRKFTRDEQAELLEIVDEYTPTGPDGKYAGPTLSMEKALEIMELRKTQRDAPRRNARNNVAALTASASQGEPSADTYSNDSPQWGNWRSRFGG